MRRLTNTLSKWSRLEYGDIFAKAKEYEERGTYLLQNYYQISKNIAVIFRGMDKEKKKYHWASWETHQYPVMKEV
ncbi:hypothetical protein H5410_013512 [Solanum commersonii]|uniref:Uncharacterized protein n=1 Tax=Solanum commersonii TaxID=4109 RepID=A0A9J5ZNG0_SOLCO|nr:hypothetical protein H5410_013512 [Solanum commersonii]